MNRISNVINLTSENAISRIIYGLLMERQIIFLPIISLKFVVQCAAKILKNQLNMPKNKFEQVICMGKGDNPTSSPKGKDRSAE